MYVQIDRQIDRQIDTTNLKSKHDKGYSSKTIKELKKIDRIFKDIVIYTGHRKA